MSPLFLYLILSLLFLRSFLIGEPCTIIHRPSLLRTYNVLSSALSTEVLEKEYKALTIW